MQLLNKKEVAAKIGVHPEHLARMVREGKFPKPIRLGGTEITNRVRFVESEVDDWIKSKMEARPQSKMNSSLNGHLLETR